MNFRVLVVLFSASLASCTDVGSVHLKAFKQSSGDILYDRNIYQEDTFNEDNTMQNGFGARLDEKGEVVVRYGGKEIQVKREKDDGAYFTSLRYVGKTLVTMTISEALQHESKYVTVKKDKQVLFSGLVFQHVETRGVNIAATFMYPDGLMIEYWAERKSVPDIKRKACRQSCASKDCIGWKYADKTCETFFIRPTDISRLKSAQKTKYEVTVSHRNLNVLKFLKKPLKLTRKMEAEYNAPDFQVTVVITNEAPQKSEPEAAEDPEAQPGAEPETEPEAEPETADTQKDLPSNLSGQTG